MEKLSDELRGILLFRGCVLRSSNSHGQSTTKLTKKRTRTATTKHYDWAFLNNRFETLQERTEKGNPNDEYENFVEAHQEAASKCIPTKPRTKNKVPWETLVVKKNVHA